MASSENGFEKSFRRFMGRAWLGRSNKLSVFINDFQIEFHQFDITQPSLICFVKCGDTFGFRHIVIGEKPYPRLVLS